MDSVPSAAPERVDPTMRAQALETHMSVLFFYGDRVLKVRKPVKYGFADFRDTEQRRADCWREIQLNRRLSPDVYVGTATVLLNGKTVEHAVVMHRLPEERNLATLVAHGENVDAELASVAELLARFHRDARRSPGISSAATVTAIGQRWQATAEELGRFIGPVIDADAYHHLTALAHRFLREWRSLFERRIELGAVCDGHGDLQAADVFCLPDGPRLLDCLEFDDQLRYGDELADVAFLVQDLERIGGVREARVFFDAYRKASSTDQPLSLLDFYVAARAHVRLLVECLRREQRLETLAQDPPAVLAQALSHLEMAIPRLVLVGGPPGSGKSTVASSLADVLTATLLSTDHVRPRHATGRSGPAPFGTGQYTLEKRRDVYRQVMDRAVEALHDARSVVIDATWSRAEFRKRAESAARAASATLVELQCRCAPEERTRRILGRANAGAGESDATPQVAEALSDVTDPWPTALVVDTSGSIDESRRAALQALRGRRSTPEE